MPKTIEAEVIAEPILPQETVALTVTPMQLIARAIDKGLDAEQLGKLMELQITWQKNEARLAYVAAMEKFKSNLPTLLKNKHVKAGQAEYDHVTLDKAIEVISPALLKEGIVANWRTGEEAGRIVVTCVFTHKLGHAEDVATLKGPPDTSGSKNNVQAIGSTTTYLQRYTLLSGAGVAAKNQDNDGKTEGLGQTIIDDYCIAMQDAFSVDDLQRIWTESMSAAKKAGDLQASQTFIQVKEVRKKELRPNGQPRA